jgi:lipopolysaccharide export system protein LptA
MRSLRPAPGSPLIRVFAGTAMLGAVLLCAAPLGAQSLTNSFGGLSESSDDPIDIESDVLVVQDKQKLATFKGNVKAVQGSTTIRAKELQVHYVGGDKLSPAAGKEPQGEAAAANAAAEKEDTKITKIEARGDVVIVSADDQTTTSDWALYDLPAQLVTVGGNVVLTQGKNVLKGDRLVIDLQTGESRFENTGEAAAGGRIRALFMPKQDGKDAKPGAKTEQTSKRQGEFDAAETRGETPEDDGAGDVPWPIMPGAQ